MVAVWEEMEEEERIGEAVVMIESWLFSVFLFKFLSFFFSPFYFMFSCCLGVDWHNW